MYDIRIDAVCGNAIIKSHYLTIMNHKDSLLNFILPRWRTISPTRSHDIRMCYSFRLYIFNVHLMSMTIHRFIWCSLHIAISSQKE